MIAWWTSRSRREQILLAVLGTLALVTVVWLGAFRPLAAAARAADTRLARAAEVEAAVDRGLAELAVIRRHPRPRTASRPVAEVVVESAAAADLTLARSEPDPGGGLRISLEAVAPGALFPWLATLQREHGVAPSHLTVLKSEGGALTVDATLVGIEP